MYDIRKKNYEEPRALRFDDDNEDGGNVSILETITDDTQSTFVRLSDGGDTQLYIDSVDAAQGLTEALNWAIEKGWWDNVGVDDE